MTWEKVEPYNGPIYQGCLHGPLVEKVANLNMIVAVGFGDAYVSKDEEVVFTEQMLSDDFHTLREFEEMAVLDPDHDWRCVLYAPLRGEEYQRHDVGKWVLIDSNMGFA